MLILLVAIPEKVLGRIIRLGRVRSNENLLMLFFCNNPIAQD